MNRKKFIEKWGRIGGRLSFDATDEFEKDLDQYLSNRASEVRVRPEVMPKIAEAIDDLIKDQDDLSIDSQKDNDKVMYKYCKGRLEFLKRQLSNFTA